MHSCIIGFVTQLAAGARNAPFAKLEMLTAERGRESRFVFADLPEKERPPYGDLS
jgi:hypothetical protein